MASEPEGSANWFPLNDHPTDKAAFTFVVTVPAGLEGSPTAASSGGGPTATGPPGSGTPDPMAPYLATATIGQFDLRSYRTAQGLRMYDAVDPDLFTRAGRPRGSGLADLRGDRGRLAGPPGRDSGLPVRAVRALPVLDRRGNRGRRPDLFFALENQTRSIYPGPSYRPDRGDLLVVHENAHQWFGDSVALAEWKHMWLNEGFATYAEWLWGEREGLGTTQEIFDAI